MFNNAAAYQLQVPRRTTFNHSQNAEKVCIIAGVSPALCQERRRCGQTQDQASLPKKLAPDISGQRQS